MITLELLSSRRVNSLLNPVQALEVDVVAQELHELWLENKDDSGILLILIIIQYALLVVIDDRPCINYFSFSCEQRLFS